MRVTKSLAINYLIIIIIIIIITYIVHWYLLFLVYWPAVCIDQCVCIENTTYQCHLSGEMFVH